MVMVFKQSMPAISPKPLDDNNVENAALVKQLVSELNRSGGDITMYGKSSSDKLNSYTDKYLDTVSLMDMNEFSKPLSDVLVLCTSVNGKSITQGKLGAKIPFFSQMKLLFASSKAKAVAYFNTVKDQIDDVLKEVDVKENSLKNNMKVLQGLYEQNLEEYRVLSAYIKAGEMVKEKKNSELEAFRTENQNTQDPLVSVQIQDKQDFVDKLDRKLHDLRAIQLACIQAAPQIRQEHKNAERLIEKFGAVKSMAIPLWKKQAALFITSIEHRRGVELANKIDDTTNTLYKSSADLVNKNSVETARANERGVLDTESLEYANNVLTQTIQEVTQIVEEGRNKREESKEEFEKLKTSLGQTLLANQTKIK